MKCGGVIYKSFPHEDKSQVVVAARTDPSKTQDGFSVIDASTNFELKQLTSAKTFVNCLKKIQDSTTLCKGFNLTFF
ncbi:hypothetical protein ACFFIF_09020 [Vagococcus entomophilus]|uniref:Uncharacterized protein n=1 Tax=Vagococcus entomophilus TaxID=1160095 RepID=A0A430AGU8_9ENTE|nr:hypothetical protein [Vagococcus entomophilus]RSU07103.1 hypothetical protein CBF30_07555 [Vagococcus entomophilus]